MPSANRANDIEISTMKITITTGARLHFGLLTHRPQSGRDFGGAGLMVDRPCCRLSVQLAAAEQDEVEADAENRKRVIRSLQRYRQIAPAELQPGPCKIELSEALPPHQGFGSGTQLGLALARAMSALATDAEIPAARLAQLVGRGTRSAIGIHGFDQGGFLVEGGKLNKDEISPLIARLEFPAQWRFVLISPPAADGLSGQEECQAFEQLPGMPAKITSTLCRLLVMQLLPAIAQADFAQAAAAVYDFGCTSGGYFATAQGGVFGHPRMRELASKLRRDGLAGVGQSSWGPSLFVLTADETNASQLVDSLREDPLAADSTLTIAAPRNRAADCTCETTNR